MSLVMSLQTDYETHTFARDFLEVFLNIFLSTSYFCGILFLSTDYWHCAALFTNATLDGGDIFTKIIDMTTCCRNYSVKMMVSAPVINNNITFGLGNFWQILEITYFRLIFSRYPLMKPQNALAQIKTMMSIVTQF